MQIGPVSQRDRERKVFPVRRCLHFYFVISRITNNSDNARVSSLLKIYASQKLNAFYRGVLGSLADPFCD